MDISATPILGSFLVPALDLTVKIAALLALAGLATFILRRAAAATRHLIWLSALVASLALPGIAPLVPERVGTRYALPSAPVVASAVATAGLPTPAFRHNEALIAAPLSEPPMTDVTPTGAAQGRALFPWVASLCALYLAGAAFILLQIALGAAAVRRLTHDSVVAPYDGAPGRALSAIQSETATTAAVTISLRLAPDALPMTYGWRRPIILLPDEANDWPPERLRVVLLHEIAHIVRRDWPIQMFADLICAAYWFHPLVWWAASRLRAESERACDDRVLLAGVPSDVYAEQLLAIAQLAGPQRGGRESDIRFAAPMALRAGLEPRLRAILSQRSGRIWQVRRHQIAWSTLLAGLTLIPLCLVHASGSTPVLPIEVASTPQTIAVSTWTRQAFNGAITVELVGVSLRHDDDRMPPGAKEPHTGKPLDDRIFRSTLQSSWKPDGTSFAHRLYTTGSFHSFGHRDPGRRVVEFALRIHSRGDSSAKLFTEEGSWVDAPIMVNGKAIETREWDGEIAAPADLWREALAIPQRKRTTEVRLQVAGGDYPSKWDVAIGPDSYSGQATGSTSIGGKIVGVACSGVVFNQEGRYGFVVTNSSLPGYDTHVVAIDRQGRQFQPLDYMVFANEQCVQTTVFFDPKKLPRTQIATLRFEARPYQTIEFDNVSLYPR